MPTQSQAVELDVASETSRPINVLVLDDSEVDRRRILRLCEDAGLFVASTEAGTIEEMTNSLAGQHFDLVFIDYLLAGEDGLDAVRVLVEDPNQHAVSIMIAGEGRMDIAIEAMRLGCSDYLTKSDLTVHALQKSVATALERQMMSFSLQEERERRRKLELAVRHYASTCSIEMRTILAGALRRVRKLRSYKTSEEHASQLSELETSIDRLWDSLPEFNEQAMLAIELEAEANAQRPRLLRKH